MLAVGLSKVEFWTVLIWLTCPESNSPRCGMVTADPYLKSTQDHGGRGGGVPNRVPAEPDFLVRDVHSSLAHLSRATVFGGLCQADDKAEPLPRPLPPGEAGPSGAHPSQPSHSLCHHECPDCLFPFLYLLFLRLPHSLNTEGMAELPRQPPTPTSFWFLRNFSTF